MESIIILIAIFFFLLLFGIPISYCLIFSGIVFLSLIFPTDLIVVTKELENGLDSFPLIAIPFFLLLGSLANKSGITQRLVDLSNAVVGHITGGLAHVNVFASMLMSGISGTATADTSSLGVILIPAMIKDKYPAAFSAAITATSSAVGPIIPPSLMMVVYGYMGNVSIGRLFLAGIIPGILLGLFLMNYCYFVARRKGFGLTKGKAKLTKAMILKAIIRGLLPLTVPIILVGGIVTGVFTATEASVVTCLILILIGGFVYRTLSFKRLLECFRETLYLLGAIMLIVSCAKFFGWVLTLVQFDKIIVDQIQLISSKPIVILLLLNFLLLVLGCFMEILSVLVLLTPVLVPVISNIGIDPVHFGVIMVLNLMIGMSTPPVGLSMFITSGIAKISVEKFIKAVWPMLLVMLCTLLLITLFPKLVLTIPNLLMP